MAVFEPNGKIRIGTVPWDNTYAHVRWFDSVNVQISEMIEHLGSTFYESDYTYVRKDSIIRVPINAERLYTKNYVMYQNANYGNKWFYCFIVNIEYINENMTELTLETDVFQTYMFDITFNAGFIERQHVHNDNIGLWRNPEPEIPLEYIYAERYSDPDLSNSNSMWVVVQTNATPHYENSTVPDGSDAVVGGWYSNVFSGAKYYAYTIADGGHGSDYGIFNFLQSMNQAGAAESISNIFMYPQRFIPANQRGSDFGLPENQGGYGYEKTWQRPTNLNGYVPRNNKLFTFPYCYCRVDNNNGSSIDLKFEDWDAPYRLSIQSTLDPDATVLVIPQKYQGVENNVPAALSFPICPKCSWNYSAYQTWSAQNSLNNAITVGLNIAAMAIPAARGVGAAAKLLSAGKAARAATKGTEYGKALKTAHQNKAIRAGIEKAGENWGGLSMLAGALGLANFAGEVSKQSKVPDAQKGQSSGNTLFGLGYMTYNISNVVIRHEYARIVDDFLDMYGYSIEEIRAPQITGRKNWNYVKMQNANHQGNIPTPELALINNAFDSGVTFWHTWDVGNYGLDNSIV